MINPEVIKEETLKEKIKKILPKSKKRKMKKDIKELTEKMDKEKIKY